MTTRSRNQLLRPVESKLEKIFHNWREIISDNALITGAYFRLILLELGV